MKKKYLILGDGESPHILKWIRELVTYYDVHLLSFKDCLPEIRELLPGENIHTFRMDISEGGGNVKVLKKIFKLTSIIKRIKPDIVNAHYITSYGFMAALAKTLGYHKYKLVQTAWGSDILVAPGQNKAYKIITGFSLRKADFVTADSPTVAQIINNLSGHTAMVFPFGLDKLPLASHDEKDPTLFFSNRTLNSNSNIERVIHLFTEISKHKENTQLIIANDGPLRNELELQAKESGVNDRIVFTGFISAEEQNDYYKRAGYYFSLLKSDAMSVSLIEAMSFGCIPILSPLPDNMDWVTDQENGIIFKDQDIVQAFELIKRKAKDIFNANRSIVSQRGVFPDSVREYTEALNKL